MYLSIIPHMGQLPTTMIRLKESIEPRLRNLISQRVLPILLFFKKEPTFGIFGFLFVHFLFD